MKSVNAGCGAGFCPTLRGCENMECRRETVSSRSRQGALQAFGDGRCRRELFTSAQRLGWLSLLISSASALLSPQDWVRSSTLAPRPTRRAAWVNDRLLGSRCSI